MIVLDRHGERTEVLRPLKPTPRLLVLLDRDGTVMEHRAGHVLSVDDAVFLPGALNALRALASLDVATAIVTNQSAVSRRLLDEAALLAIHRWILGEVAATGGRVFASFVCPHCPGEGCPCRKPATQMIEAARDVAGVPPAATVMVGDAYSDVAAADAVSATPILVTTGLGRETQARLRSEGRADVAVAESLPEAVRLVRALLQRGRQGARRLTRGTL